VNIMILLLAASLLLGLGFLFAFIWAVRSGQFDDTTTPSMRMFYDDEKTEPLKATRTGSNKEERKTK